MIRPGVQSPIVPDSIFGRLRLLLVTVFAIGGVAAMIAAWFFSTAAATDAYDRLLMSAATQISGAISVDQERVTVLPPDSAFETLAQSTGDRFFYAVRGPAGDLLTGYPSLAVEAPRPADGAPILGYRDHDGTRMRMVTLYRLVASPTVNGWCSVVVVQTLDARSRLVVRLMGKIGAIILFVGALGCFASLQAVRRALLPVDRIGRALAERRAADTEPLVVDSPVETRPLVEAINMAFHRLNDRMTRLQGFAGFAAHQIRTPLTAIGAQTELLLTDRTHAARAARVERIRTHIAKLSRLTNQLLGQTMVSYRADRVPHDRIALADLIRHAMRDAIPESLDRDLAVEFDAPRMPIFVEGDRMLLHEALVNLVSNAVTHGATSLLSVRVRADEHSATIGVADDGPGIAPDLWDGAARPFHMPRVDGDGAGLGLSIAADVARGHGSELAFATTGDGLFEISMTLRRVAPAGDAA
ncbi:sensor histidine kinase [Sphingomonas sp.]|uniref:sensor histidine kinase n=1 Tax=Sphingomonas sp. TaxID=28214 RepID=UPI002DD69721|nr:sensor histidine kinase [Sphingomonas sp.]